MANNSAAFGLRPIRHKAGAPYSGAARLYFYPSGQSANLFIGDPVIVISAGAFASPYFYGPTAVGGATPIVAGALPEVALATAGAGNAITGVVVGFFPEQATSNVYGLGSTNRAVWVADDPELLFEIQDDGVSASTAAWPSQSSNLNLSTFTGSTITARSGATINSTLTNGATDQLKIISLSERANNAVGKFAVWEVMINNHTLVTGVAGI